MSSFLFFAAGGLLGAVVGLIIGCPLYSGRHCAECECSPCRREKWIAGGCVDPVERSDRPFWPQPAPSRGSCYGRLHDFGATGTVGDACSCGQMEIKMRDGARYIGPRSGC